MTNLSLAEQKQFGYTNWFGKHVVLPGWKESFQHDFILFEAIICFLFLRECRSSKEPTDSTSLGDVIIRCVDFQKVPGIIRFVVSLPTTFWEKSSSSFKRFLSFQFLKHHLFLNHQIENNLKTLVVSLYFCFFFGSNRCVPLKLKKQQKKNQKQLHKVLNITTFHFSLWNEKKRLRDPEDPLLLKENLESFFFFFHWENHWGVKN